MRTKALIAVLALSAAPLGSAMADSWFRNLFTTGATIGSTYATTHDNKLVLGAREDAGSFVASNGEIRGPYLEAALQRVRAEQPDLAASDMELATAILMNEDAPR
ncbi:DUF2388 domain-containing protein [Stutzerimonas azotifigens]|uniref:DUF2388 domain-containing protein n=1 Tax=Stutzerimonas azotifigens TaxID=291995 RepID=A0ABR5YYV3_9GAMM|nr:DUF2388 domain-containing protein [Stutzerimonas azotifigens]MBA1273078.1 DUF2388 domain-containing protein [Stutzerimonas azotifigens]